MPKEETVQLTKYEKARIIGSRALQIALGAPILVKLSEEELKKARYDPLEIAKIEFTQGLVPITIKRTVIIPNKDVVAV